MRQFGQMREEIEDIIKEEGIVDEEDLLSLLEEWKIPDRYRKHYKYVIKRILDTLCAEGKIYKKVHYCEV